MKSMSTQSQSALARMSAIMVIIICSFMAGTNSAAAQCDWGVCLQSTLIVGGDPGNLKPAYLPLTVTYNINDISPTVQYFNIYNALYHPGNYGSCLISVTVTLATGQSVTVPVGSFGKIGPLPMPPATAPNSCVLVTVQMDQDNCHTVRIWESACP